MIRPERRDESYNHQCRHPRSPSPVKEVAVKKPRDSLEGAIGSKFPRWVPERDVVVIVREENGDDPIAQEKDDHGRQEEKFG